MPTDENTQAVQQNGNPMGDPSTSSNSGNADDFDFSFDSELDTSSVGNNINQGVNQGRTGMFLTPDEEAEKLQNSGQVSNGQDTNPGEDSALSANNDSYFPNVNNNVGANDNVQLNEDNIGNISFDQKNDSQNDKFDEKIENLISFDDDSSVDSSVNADNLAVNVDDLAVNVDNSGVNVDDLAVNVDNSGVNVDDSGVNVDNSGVNVDKLNTDDFSIDTNEAALENKDETVDLGENLLENSSLNNEETVVQNMGNLENIDVSETREVPEITENVENTEVENTENEETVDLGNNSQSDDWLQQEDKKVEETFGIKNMESQDIGVNESPVDVAQNVEAVINNTTPDNDNNFGQNNVVVNDNIGNNDTSLPDGLGQQIDSQAVEPNYVPNEADFSAMSNLLNSSTTGQVNLSNVDNQPESNINFGVDLGGINDNLAADPVQNQGNEFVEIGVVNPLDTMTNTVENTIGNVGINLDNIGDPRFSDLGNIDSNVGNIDSNVGNVDSNVGNISTQGVHLNTMIDQEIQDMHVQPQSTPNIDQTQSQNVQVQNVNRKKQSGFKVIGIFLGVFVGVCGLIYGASVMFPDKFKMFKKDVVVEYLTGNENNVEIENNDQVVENPDNQNENGENNDVLEQNEELITENNGELGNLDENGEDNNETNEIPEDLDPNSLAGLLLSDDNGTGDNTSSTENLENTGLVNNEISDSGNNGTGEEFDPFSQIDGVLTEEKSDSDRLNEYIVQGTYYKELGISKDDKKMEKYGDYIIFTATEELTKLEKGEEIDNSVFSRLDSTLETLQE